MAQTSIKVHGLKEFEKALKQLETKKAKAIVRAANHRAMLPTVKAAKAMTPVESGALKRSLIRKTKTYTASGVVWTGISADKRVVAWSGPAAGLGEKRWPTKYLHLVEFGTSKTPAVGMLRGAYAQTDSVVHATLRRLLRERLTKAAKS